MLRRRRHSKRTTLGIGLLVLVVLVGALVLPRATAHDVTCARTDRPGGDWPMFSHDLEGSRAQPADHRVLPPVLPLWTFDANRSTHAKNNEITGYPIVSDGCVYVGSSTGNDAAGGHLPGWVFALNADNGDVVWQTQVDGGVYSTVAVDSGIVYAFVSRISSPYVVALDQADGDVLWQTTVDNQIGSDAVSSPIVHDGMLWVGVSGTAAEGDEADRHAFQGSSVLLATDSAHGYQPGDIVKKTYSIPPDVWSQGYAGGAQWGTISIDSAAGFGYVGTGNPFNYDAEHPNTNAVLKLDLRWASATFGQFVAGYKGDVEEFFPAASDAPGCEEAEQISGVFAAGVECLNLDLDFGVAPNIYTDKNGRRVVAAGQKSGVMHFIDADTMEALGKTLIGAPSAVGGIVGSAAYDGTNIYGPHTLGGYLFAMNATDHSVKWVSPTGDAVHWGPPVTYANGVLWTVDLKGFLDAYDPVTGAPLHHLPMAVGSDTRENPTFSWGGVTVARNAVFASVGVGLTSAGLPSMPNGYVIAFGNVGHVA
jgi:polyvinyl alcohol dehydrogenase (cytochrome)